MSETAETKSCWDHLEDLRGSLIRILVAALLFSVLAFCFKDLLF
jgi:Sec-independent protein secretion pathway component TatC